MNGGLPGVGLPGVGLPGLGPAGLGKGEPTEMDGTLQTDFRKSETSRDIKTYF